VWRVLCGGAAAAAAVAALHIEEVAGAGPAATASRLGEQPLPAPRPPTLSAPPTARRLREKSPASQQSGFQGSVVPAAGADIRRRRRRKHNTGAARLKKEGERKGLLRQPAHEEVPERAAHLRRGRAGGVLRGGLGGLVHLPPTLFGPLTVDRWPLRGAGARWQVEQPKLKKQKVKPKVANVTGALGRLGKKRSAPPLHNV
jgi:hypothetical protein